MDAKKIDYFYKALAILKNSILAPELEIEIKQLDKIFFSVSDY